MHTSLPYVLSHAHAYVPYVYLPKESLPSHLPPERSHFGVLVERSSCPRACPRLVHAIPTPAGVFCIMGWHWTGPFTTFPYRVNKNELYNLREYTYVPQGSGIVYITITRGACSSATNAPREGPRRRPATRGGVPPDRVKTDTS